MAENNSWHEVNKQKQNISRELKYTKTKKREINDLISAEKLEREHKILCLFIVLNEKRLFRRRDERERGRRTLSGIEMS